MLCFSSCFSRVFVSLKVDFEVLGVGVCAVVHNKSQSHCSPRSKGTRHRQQTLIRKHRSPRSTLDVFCERLNIHLVTNGTLMLWITVIKLGTPGGSTENLPGNGYASTFSVASVVIWRLYSWRNHADHSRNCASTELVHKERDSKSKIPYSWIDFSADHVSIFHWEWYCQ